MSSKKNIAAIRSLIDEVYANGNLELLDELIHPNIKFSDVATKEFKSGLEQFKELERRYATAFPDKKPTILDMYSDGETVICHIKLTGTHKGDLKGIPATGKKFTVTGISIYEFEKGKIVRLKRVWDKLGLLEQLGVVSEAAIH